MGLSSLNDLSAPLVLDASTAINLTATGFAPQILRAIPHRILITDVAMDELRIDSRTNRNDGQLVAGYVADGLMTEVSLDTLQSDDFERLVTGRSADTLDDGEAATVAWAVETGAIAVIDERKAKRIASVRYPALLVASTGDVLGLTEVERALGRSTLADATYQALREARMRILPEHIEWVVGLIGDERVINCVSLPEHVRAAARRRTSGG